MYSGHEILFQLNFKFEVFKFGVDKDYKLAVLYGIGLFSFFF